MPAQPPDDVTPATPPTVTRAGDDVAPPPPMPVQTTLYIGPDGQVSFGALFDALVPVARGLDPAFRPAIPGPDEPA